MYKIMRNTNGVMRRFNNKTYPTYAEARQYVRKYIRKKIGVEGYSKVCGSCMEYDNINRNFPSIGVVGFSIRKL